MNDSTSDCVFCRIVAGTLPACRVYENPHILAFMDINPVIKGHTLVIPKAHYDPITRTPDEVLVHVITAVRHVATAVWTGLKADGLNVTQANGAVAGQCVPHIHFHVIPRYENSDNPRNWIPGKYASTAEMETFADRIRRALPTGT
ncbi:MAG: hypothetical protein A2498_04895 [Lentisphaerae bacterium RIFOXYC12_FULL_60_16]|nr:MAG: hypothetical protein A2498_04895 [Lentisphaerae bacterium RIFOXYC12_FULL_60_16]OGV70855.1 MAG: hypothetical protein A2269_01765 [Lentisphaerae bacterium RIFOXYA12_FULL_60_10]OGV86708.1 MAG: hypothetical protein A2340_10535 [Lentisphaerae bacterium RIFOXYB12_FULL_60_10]